MIVIAAMLGWRCAPREWLPRELNQLRWALGCDDIENLERLLNRDETERMDQGYYNHLLDTGLEPGLAQPICRTVAELREAVLIPYLSIVRANGTTWLTNERGMRANLHKPVPKTRGYVSDRDDRGLDRRRAGRQ